MPQNSTLQTIPQDIVDLINSEETAFIISEICLKNNVEKEEDIEKITYQIARVLLGCLSPDLLAKGMLKEENIAEEIAENIAQEVKARLFSRVKESLNLLYGEEGGDFSYENKSSPESFRDKNDVYREGI